MKKIIGLLLFILILINNAPPVWANVVLLLPEPIQVVAVNGKKANGVGSIVLPDGLNQIAIRVLKEFGQSFDEDLEYSDVLVVKFQAVNTNLRLTIPPITSQRAIRAFNRDPRIQLINADGVAITHNVAKLKKEGLQLIRNYEQELIEFNQTDSPAAVKLSKELSQKEPKPIKTVTESTQSPRPSVKSKVDMTQNNSQPQSLDDTPKALKNVTDDDDSKMAEKMLKYWYQQADALTRERFKRWINRNSANHE